ncbi:SusC/RagA family TonB-linked outer membrane protein [Chitinophaga sp. YIM B06452]|uniref:SusC/RagA family TonB-linked outer membrane protein n=1 Tax=Chitinophaga sp. YIM B06452 TaxID=3082158 RepID=UPI0031FED4EB
MGQSWTICLRSIMLLCAFHLSLHLPAFSTHSENDQGKVKVTLVADNMPIKQALRRLEKQSGLTFFFSSYEVKMPPFITVRAIDKSLDEVLGMIFKGAGLEWEYREDIVTIRKKKVGAPTSSANGPDSTITSVQVTGKVTDADGKPIPGATIIVKGTTDGTTADENGTFSLQNVPTNKKLLIRSLGFQEMEVPVRGGTKSILVKLMIDINRLDEFAVLSTGYETLPRERVTGSFSQPIKEVYDARVSTDVLTKLNGITPGLLFNNNTSLTSNGKLDLSIRGRSTIFANDQPLVVVDNFPYDGDISNINPNDVENVTVLKDAAAASIWGVRAGNGVIVITTKKGNLNQPLRVSFNSNVTIGEKPDLFYDPNFMSASDMIGVEQQLFAQGFYDNNINTEYMPISPVVNILNKERSGVISPAEAQTKIASLKNADIRNDLKKYFYRKSVNQQYALNFNGGNAQNAYYASIGYDKNASNLVNNDYDRITLNIVNTFTPIKKLSLTGNINYIQNKTENDNTLSGLTSGFNGTIYPYATVADNAGNALPIVKGYSPVFAETATQKGYLNWQYFPLTELRNQWNNDNTATVNDLRAFAGLKYDILPGISAEVKYQYQKATTQLTSIFPEESFYTRDLINRYSIVDPDGNVVGYNIPKGAIYGKTISDLTSENFRAHLTANKGWGKHYLASIAGFEVRSTETESTNSGMYGFNKEIGAFTSVAYATYYPLNPDGNYGQIPDPNRYGKTIDRFRSYFGNAAYTYADKYTLSASARIDGSNYFGVKTNQKNVPLWSVGGKWDIDKESFYKINWLPYLKFRATYGYNGNLDRSITGITTFRYTGIPSRYTNAVNAVISNIGNADLRWEKIKIYNIGVDFGIKNEILTGSIEFFHKSGIDLIGDAVMPPSSGVTTMRGNYAKIKGSGFDLKLNTKNVDQEIRWTTTFLLSGAYDKVIDYTGEVTPNSLLSNDNNIYPWNDKPVYGVYSLKWAGLDPNNGDPQGFDTKGTVSKDYSSLLQPDSINGLNYHGPGRPTIYGGISNSVTYKGFSLLINISYKMGYYFRRNGIQFNKLFNYYLGHKEFSNRWQKPGDETHTNVPSLTYPGDQNRDEFYRFSEALVSKGDHVRLQDISIGYTLDKSKWKRLPFQSVQFYIYANNIGILWKANSSDIDPDYPVGGVPPPKTFAFGFKLNM